MQSESVPEGVSWLREASASLAEAAVASAGASGRLR